jgi:HSP20 family protein
VSRLGIVEAKRQARSQKGDKAMPEVPVVKEPKGRDLARWFEFDAPLLRGNFFALNPFALMRRFTEEMDRFFTPTASPGQAGFWAPAIEVKQKDGKLLVTAELPGLGKDDIKVHIEGDTLVLEGERKREKEEKREGYYHSERTYGTFYRAVPLPEGAKAEETAAQFNNGVLEVAVPLSEVKAKEIPVTEGTKKAA